MLPRAITSDEHTLIQQNGQFTELLACIPLPATVYTAQVNGAPSSTDQLTQVTYDGGSGTLANVKPGMTIFIGTTPGAYDVGQARIRNTPTSTIFYLGTESELNILDNQYLTVVDEFGLWQKQVRIASGVIYMDYDVTYSNQNASRLPVVVMGGPVVLELTGASVTAHFDASGSWVPGGGSATYSWAAPGASSTSGLSGATPTMTYTAAGRYRVSCTATIGGVANTRYEYVQVFDAGSPPVSQFQVKSIAGSKSQGGYAFQMTLFAEADTATVRDRAQVILFTRDFYGASGQQAAGYATGRENILCIGWIAGETIQWSPDYSSVTFQVEGAYAWLDRITAYPQGLEDVTTTPTKWTDYDTLTMQAFLWHLFTWRSTVAQAIDCYVEASSTRIIEMSAAATSLWQQLQVTAGQRLLAQPCTDHLSRLFVLIDSQLRSDRSGVVEVMTLAKADWRMPAQVNRNPLSTVSMVDLSGFKWDGVNATALFALAPGRVWKRYGRVQSVQAQLLADQASANTLAGLVCGQANNDYPAITLTLGGNNRFLDIAPDCYAKLSLAAGDTPRGVSFTNKRLIPRRISWSYDPAGGVLLPAIEFEGETFAELGITGDAPPTQPPPVPPPPPSETCPTGYHWDAASSACVPNSGATPGDRQTMFLLNDYSGLFRTFNFLAAPSSSSPHWENVWMDGLRKHYVFKLDPWDPVNKGLAITKGKLYAITGVTGTVSASAVLADADITTATGLTGTILNSYSLFFTSINASGRLYLIAGGPTDDAAQTGTPRAVWVGRTDNYAGGAGTWTWTQVGTAAFPDLTYAARMHVAQNGGDRVIVTFRKSGSTYMSVFVSNDNGATFSEHLLSSEGIKSHDLLPFSPISLGNDVIYLVDGTRASNEDPGQARVLLSTGGLAGPWVDKTPSSGLTNSQAVSFADPESVTESPASDGSNLFLAWGDSELVGYSGILKYDKNADTWSVVVPYAWVNNGTFYTWSGLGFGGWPWDNLGLQIGNNVYANFVIPTPVRRSSDGGATWENATGDLNLGTGGIVTWLVPVWIAY